MTATDLHHGHILALSLIARVGEDGPGIVDDEDKFAAALVYLDLLKRGLVWSRQGSEGPVFSLSQAGRDEIARRAA